MTNEYESLAKMLMSTPQGSRIVKSLDALNAIAASDNGKQLIEMLAGNGGDAIKKAAGAAIDNDRDLAKTMMSSLLSTKEGAALAAKVIELING